MHNNLQEDIKLGNIRVIVGLSLLLLLLLVSYQSEASTQETIPNSIYHNDWMALDSLSQDKLTTENEKAVSYDTINVDCQNDFELLNDYIKERISKGSNDIFINFSRGRYFYKEGHVNLYNIENKSLRIIFEGNESNFYGVSKICRFKIDPKYSYSRNNRFVSMWSKVVQVDDSIKCIQGFDKPLYRIKTMPTINAKTGDYIQISQWFRSSTYRIVSVENGYIYFDSSESYDGNVKNWDVNFDLRYGKEMPRYRVFDATSDTTLYQHIPVNFFDIGNSHVEELKFLDMNFHGGTFSDWKGIINISNTKSRLTLIESCSFSECNNLCITLRSSHNVCIENCNFSNNNNGCIFCDNECYKTQLLNSTFVKNGNGWRNSFNVRFSGQQFLIANNIFSDFNYGAICVGAWWGSPKRGIVTGIVEDNTIYYTPDFYNDYKNYTLMDGGAIYVMTKNDDIHLRYNRIYNIRGMSDYRGIFCDDGTCNVKIYGNIITGIESCYTIDLRYVPSVESNSKYDFGKVNVGDTIIYNFIDGDIRFEGRSENEGNANECLRGMSIFLNTSPNSHQGNISSKNISIKENDYCIQKVNINQFGVIEIPDSSIEILKRHPIYNRVKRWFGHCQ